MASTASDGQAEAILGKLSVPAVRVRLHDFFTGFGKRITPNQGIRALDQAGCKLSPAEADVIVANYTGPTGLFEYNRLIEDVNNHRSHGFFEKNAHIEPALSPSKASAIRPRFVSSRSAGSAGVFVPLSEEELISLDEVLDRVRAQVKAHGIDVRHYMKDAEPVPNSGIITVARFKRELKRCFPNLNEADASLLAKAYSNADGTEVRFVVFHADVSEDFLGEPPVVIPGVTTHLDQPTSPAPFRSATSTGSVSRAATGEHFPLSASYSRGSTSSPMGGAGSPRGFTTASRATSIMPPVSMARSNSCISSAFTSSPRPSSPTHAQPERRPPSPRRCHPQEPDTRVVDPHATLRAHTLPGDDLAAVEAHVIRQIYERRIGINDVFADFDRMRKGLITRNQFARGLTLLKLDSIGPEAIDALASKYVHRGDPTGMTVDYTPFVAEVERAFVEPGLERDPHLVHTIESFAKTVVSAPSPRKSRGDVAEDAVEVLEAALETVRSNIRTGKIMNTRSLFEAYDRSPVLGMVTEAQFLRVCQQLKLFPASWASNGKEIKAILDRYRGKGAKSTLTDYRAFTEDVYEDRMLA